MFLQCELPAPTSGVSQGLGTPVPGILTPSSDLHRHHAHKAQNHLKKWGGGAQLESKEPVSNPLDQLKPVPSSGGKFFWETH